MEIGIFANESDDNFLGSRELDNEYESEYLVRLDSTLWGPPLSHDVLQSIFDIFHRLLG